MNKKVVLITGSSRGIGANLAENFAQKDYKVVINYSKSEKEAKDQYSKIITLTDRDSVLCIKADVSNRSNVNTMFDEIYGTFGKIDVLINNAGINMDMPFIDMTEDAWANVISTILTGSFNCSQEFARRFRESTGHIINIGALTAVSGRKNGINYCTARAGILNFTHCLALELAPRICVNTVSPGCINTEEVMTRKSLYDKESYNKTLSLIPSGRLGTPEDIFNAIYFLVNDSTYITGQNIIVDGGYLMR